jgi:hypothetical protein
MPGKSAHVKNQRQHQALGEQSRKSRMASARS